jgi:hypothetical protein
MAHHNHIHHHLDLFTTHHHFNGIGMFLILILYISKLLAYEYGNEDDVWHPTPVQLLFMMDALVGFLFIVSYFLNDVEPYASLKLRHLSMITVVVVDT